MANEYLAARMETVRPLVPYMYEADATNTLYGQFTDQIPEHKIVKTPNSTDFRIPVQVEPVGQFGALNLAGGAVASGTPGSLQQMYQTYFATQYSASINMEEILNSADQAKSVVNAFDRAMKDLPGNLVQRCDASLHSLGAGNTGLIALGSSYLAGVFTLDTEYGANLLVPGQRVEIFANNLGTHRTTGLSMDNLPYLSVVNKKTGKCTVTNLGAITPSNDDYLAFPGVGASPSWINGIRYFHSTATSGTRLGLDIATYPELQSNWVAASGAYLSPVHGYQLRVGIKQRGRLADKYIGSIHPCQAAQLGIQGTAIASFLRGPNTSNDMYDLVLKMGKFVDFGEVQNFVDVHQSRKRVDWFALENWFRVYLNGVKADFITFPGTGQTTFVKYDTSGNRTMAIEFGLWNSENFGCADPGADGFISDLAIPTGFDAFA